MQRRAARRRRHALSVDGSARGTVVGARPGLTPSHHQHRARRRARDVAADRAEQHPAEAAEPARPHDEQGRVAGECDERVAGSPSTSSSRISRPGLSAWSERWRRTAAWFVRSSMSTVGTGRGNAVLERAGDVGRACTTTSVRPRIHASRAATPAAASAAGEPSTPTSIGASGGVGRSGSERTTATGHRACAARCAPRTPDRPLADGSPAPTTTSWASVLSSRSSATTEPCRTLTSISMRGGVPPRDA